MDSGVSPSDRSGKLAGRFSHLRELNSPAGYIYIVRDIDISGTYKIGYTTQPAKRFASFEDELPFRIEPVLILEIHGDAKSLEHSLHRRFRSKKKFGEWFELCDGDLRRLYVQYRDRLVMADKADFVRVRAQKAARKITYVPPDIYRTRSRVNSPGYVYIVQDEEYTKLFRILWTFDPKRINRFDVFIPIRTKVVIVEQAAEAEAHDLDRQYAAHRRIGKWLDLDDDQIQQIEDSLRPPPVIPTRTQAPMSPVRRQAQTALEPQRPPATQQIQQSAALTTSKPRRSANGRIVIFALVIIIALAIAIGLALDTFGRLSSLLVQRTETPTSAPVPTDDPICDTSRYVYGTSGFILCSSVPRELKPVRQGHCLYEHLIDGDRDGAACESFATPVFTVESAHGAQNVAPDPTDDPICDLGRYERGTRGYILCSSVPDYLKPVRRGHCLYEHLNDADDDGVACESWNR